MSTALIAYKHISPHQAPALVRASERLAASGIDLIVVEHYSQSDLHGWTRADAPRRDDWICIADEGARRRPLRIARAIGRIVRERRVDVTVVNGWADPVCWAVAAAKPWLGTRLVTVMDSTEVDRRRSAVKEAAKRAFLSRMDAVFAAGSRQVRYLERLGVDRPRIALGCDVVDNSRFAAGPGPRPPHPGAVVIGTAARLEGVKNLEAALRALREVSMTLRFPKVTWRIAGRGPLEPELRRLARALGVAVEFAGFVPYGDMPAFYAGLDLYWQPSLSEPWGLAINEAMAAGLPVLASDRCGSVEDLITPDNGWVHGISDDAMQDGLRTALADRTRWAVMGPASRRRIEAWDLDRFADGLLQAVTIALQGRDAVPVRATVTRPGLSK